MYKLSRCGICSCVFLGLVSCGSGGLTESNLIEAATSESVQRATYQTYAAKATEEGYASVAVLLEALAASEEVHSLKLNKKAAKETTAETVIVDSTLTNLYRVLTNQNYDAHNYFPDLSRTALAEKATRAEKTLARITAAELLSADLVQLAIEMIEAPDSTRVTLPIAWTVCQGCGAVLNAEVALPEECPLCKKNITNNTPIYK